MKIKQILYLMSFCLLLSATTFAQQVQEFTVSGTVVDKDKLSMPGVSVYIKDKPSKGTTTDNDGNFKLKVVYGDKMIFSFIGFKPSEHVAIKPQTDLTVTLLEDNNSLDEVVVVALGNVQRKISSVGAITTVSTKDIQSPSPSISNLLGGRAAGVISLQSSGEPGQNIADFWVRGIGTFGANSSALVLIDGLEGDLNTIDPADVESFSILKDASATAVYGVRGANGVVLVNTKKGLSGKIQITGRFNTTLSVLNRLPKYLGAYEYAQLANEARAVRNETPLYDDTEMGIIRDGLDPDLYPNVNWQDEILNKTFWRHTYYVSGRGGSDVARYFLSLGGKNESAAYKVDKNSIYSSNVSYNTYNYRINLDVNLTKSTKVYLGSDGFLSQLNQPGVANTEYIWGAQSRLTPLSIPTQYSNGMLPGRGAGELSSPYVMINHTGKAANEVYKGKSTLAINQDFSELINGLKLRVQGAYDIHSYFNERRSVQPALYNALGRASDGSLIMQETVQEKKASYSKSTRQYRKYHFEATLNYDRLFGTDHRTSALVYYYISDSKDTDDATSNLSAIPLRYQGVSSRFTYGYKDTYLLDVNFGYTGSEAFASGNRFGFFPAVGLAYYISNESFYPEVIKKYVPKLKLRASVGRAGNDNTGGTRFLYRPTYKMDAGGFTQGYNDTGGGLNGIGNGIIEGRFAAPYLGWEVEDKQNYGFDIGLFDNRLEVIFDYFDSTRSQILLQRQTVPQLGGLRDDPWQNFGKVRNRGVDMSVNAHQNIGKVKLSARGTFTFTRNKILEYDELPPKYDYQAITGKRVSDKDNLYYIAERLYTEDDFTVSTNANGLKTYKLRSEIPQPTLGGLLGPGDIKYTDVNGDGIIDSYDRVRGIGHPETPEIIYGFGLNAEYKGIYASIFFQGAGNTSVLLGGKTSEGWYPFSWGVDQSNYRTFALNRWTENNPSQDVIIPRLHKSNANNANNRVASTWWLRDGSFLRLKNIEIGYQIPKKFLSKIGFEAARIYLMGYNLAVWDHIKYFDPEAGNANAGLNYPLPRTYTIGLDFSF